MTALTFVRTFDPAPITTLLCDADDNLFGSERPAFDASTEVTSPAVTDAQDADDGGPDRQAEAASNEDYRWADSRPTGNSRLCDAAPNPEVESRCMAYFDARRGGPDRDTAVDQSDDEY